MPKKHSNEFIKEQLEKDGYVLTSEYVDANTKFAFICPSGHVHSMTYGSWKQGSRCYFCYGKVKHTTEFIKSKFIEKGYIPKFTEYKNANTKLDYICPEGHEHNITWAHFKNGKGCPSCAGKIKLIFEKVRANFIQRGYTPKFTNYKNAHTKLDYTCPEGHKHSTTWANWQSGYRCPHCSGNARLTINFIKPSFEKMNCILISTEYKNSKTKLDYICSKGHEHNISWDNWCKGKGCPKCGEWGTSNFEQEVKKFILDQGQEIIENDRTTIMGNKGKHLELDILLPCKTKAIECNGSYWHDRPEAKKRDKIKQKQCKKLGINLLTITDEVWYNDRKKCEKLIKELINGITV